MLEPLDHYAGLAEACDTEEFIRRHPGPVLVIGAFEVCEETGAWTRRLEPNSEAATHMGTSVAPIAKREGSSRFRSMIVVGRSSTSDIRIRANEVSKVHAYLQLKDGAVQLTDAGSTNGTFVNGARLKPNVETVTLSPGDEIKLGVITARFHDANSFHAFLRDLVTG